jgi:hypothetical protein
VPLLFLMPIGVESAGPVYENVLFENISVTTPHIAKMSPFGAASENPARTGKVVFRNLVINGKKVTAQNCGDYFDLAKGVTVGQEIVFE